MKKKNPASCAASLRRLEKTGRSMSRWNRYCVSLRKGLQLVAVTTKTDGRSEMEDEPGDSGRNTAADTG